MTSAKRTFALVFALLSWAPFRSYAEPLSAERALLPERNVLLQKIFRGEDVAASLRLYKQLYDRRRQILDEAKQASQAKQSRQKELEEYQKTSLDYESFDFCRFSAPVPRGHRSTDWGKVVRQTAAAIDAQGGMLLDDAAVAIFEVEGQDGRHFVALKDPETWSKKKGRVPPKVGDLALFCNWDERTRKDLLPPWNTVKLSVTNTFGRITEPPRIVRKSAWNPIHISQQDLRDAIMYKKWNAPPGRHVLALVQVEKVLEDGRLAMVSHYWRDPFVLDVPPSLPRKELLQPGEYVWVIMGSPRFDKELDKLVLTAADVELRYLIER